MLIKEFIITLLVMIMASLLAEPIARWLRLSFVAILIVVGFVGSEIIVYFGGDTGIRASNFPLLVFYVLLPIIVFESAYSIDQKQLKKSLAPILLLAIPIMGLATLLIAFLIYKFIGHPTGFPVYTALVAASLLASTDPMAVIKHLKSANTPNDTVVLLEGESLFNDAFGIVLFTSLVALAVSYSNSGAETFQINWPGKLIEFSRQFFGGLIFGSLCGLTGMFFSYIVQKRILENILLIAIAYGTFLLAEDYFKVSGMMAVLAAGLIMNKAHQKYVSKEDKVFIDYWWEVISYFSTSMLFLLLGVTVTMEMFSERWLAMLLAILAVIIARFTSIFVLLPVFSLFNKYKPSFQQGMILTLGGTRGAVTAALALSLPVEIEGWWTVQSMAFGVIIFTLFIQAPAVPLLLKKNNI